MRLERVPRSGGNVRSDAGSGTGRLAVAAVIFGGLLLTSAVVQAQVLYRWINEQGRQEISHTIPAEVVHRGYEILDGDTMHVERKVPPQMTDEEYQRRLEHEREIAACESALDRVNFLYEILEDIDKAESAAKKSLDLRIQNAQQSLLLAKKRLSALEAEAARIERSGNRLHKNKLEEIERANSQIAKLEREIKQRENEQAKAELTYEEERKMFAMGTCPDNQPVANR